MCVVCLCVCVCVCERERERENEGERGERQADTCMHVFGVELRLLLDAILVRTELPLKVIII